MILLNEREHLETLETMGRAPESVERVRETANTMLLRFPWGMQRFYLWEKNAPLVILAS